MSALTTPQQNIIMKMNKSKKQLAASGTFALNKAEPIHRWYSYLEGYSSCLISELLDELPEHSVKSIYDPFGGTGTTMLVASQRGIKSYYSEINPFMVEVVEAKINLVPKLLKTSNGTKYLEKLISDVKKIQQPLPLEKITWNGFEKFFNQDSLAIIFEIKQLIDAIKDIPSRKIAQIALASIIVRSSLMIRRGDLRKARADEKKDADFNVVHNFIDKMTEILSDISTHGKTLLFNTERLCYDSRDIEAENLFDCVITSPPYLNGTNYIRNTKLELKLLDFVTSEDDLPQFHSKGIIAGINNVSKRNAVNEILPCVRPYIEKITPVAYDQRIPVMIAGYFADMYKVITRLAHGLIDGGYFIMDIGDSQFCGVHIPTHDILSVICKELGFEKYEEKILRVRHSNNGTELSQRLLKFRLHKSKSFEDASKSFMNRMPYKQEPYNGRNWGHDWHSLCSYHGKLKPAIAHFLISEFTKPGDIILDPLCGVGTIPFEACLQGRIGVGNDLSEMAYIVTKAKLERPDYQEVMDEILKLSKYIDSYTHGNGIDADFAHYEGFGFNKTLKEYFHEKTFKEILAARQYYNGRFSLLSPAECMALSALLHILHGNRPYALSRTSHPLTPYAPKGDYIYKNLIEHLKDKIDIAYSNCDFDKYIHGQAILGDFTKITESLRRQADYIICSPPFADSIRFYMQNWMRLWMCGWETEDFKSADERFLDVKQQKNFDVYTPFFNMCHQVLNQHGKIILHLGRTAKIDMAEELAKKASPFFREVFRASEAVEQLEKHGVRDKGGTVEHQFLFLEKK